MRKTIIHLYGASGSGTSTLGGFISEKLGDTSMDSDDYYWLKTKPEYTVSRDIPKRLRLMEKDIMESKGAVSIQKYKTPLRSGYICVMHIGEKVSLRKPLQR